MIYHSKELLDKEAENRRDCLLCKAGLRRTVAHFIPLRHPDGRPADAYLKLSEKTVATIRAGTSAAAKVNDLPPGSKLKVAIDDGRYTFTITTPETELDSPCP